MAERPQRPQRPERVPRRLRELLSIPVLVSKLVSTYARAHEIDEAEAEARLDRALRGTLHERLLEATWAQLRGLTSRLSDERLLDKVWRSLEHRPLRRARAIVVDPDYSAFLVVVDLELRTASDTARRVMETHEGRLRVARGFEAVGRHLARELTRR